MRPPPSHGISCPKWRCQFFDQRRAVGPAPRISLVSMASPGGIPKSRYPCLHNAKILWKRNTVWERKTFGRGPATHPRGVAGEGRHARCTLFPLHTWRAIHGVTVLGQPLAVVRGMSLDDPRRRRPQPAPIRSAILRDMPTPRMTPPTDSFTRQNTALLLRLASAPAAE
jgi:hypothetical protein